MIKFFNNVPNAKNFNPPLAMQENNMISKFCKRCFCPRCRTSNAQPYMYMYVILQAFDNAADQVKAALPQGSVFAEYNGGVPLILIHQQGEC